MGKIFLQPKKKGNEKMTLTQKENALLQDLKTQEEVCIEKYGMYADAACDTNLKNLFESIKKTEQTHLETISKIMNGTEVSMPSPPPSASSVLSACTPSSCSAEQKKKDAYLCQDALSMEKHVSSLYDTSIFEFNSPTLRDTLNHIQKEEQNHGEQLYKYMSCNNLA